MKKFFLSLVLMLSSAFLFAARVPDGKYKSIIVSQIDTDNPDKEPLLLAANNAFIRVSGDVIIVYLDGVPAYILEVLSVSEGEFTNYTCKNRDTDKNLIISTRKRTSELGVIYDFGLLFNHRVLMFSTQKEQ